MPRIHSSRVDRAILCVALRNGAYGQCLDKKALLFDVSTVAFLGYGNRSQTTITSEV